MLYIYKPVQRLLNYILSWSILCYDLNSGVWVFRYFHSEKEANKFYNDYNKTLKDMKKSGKLDKIPLQRKQTFLKIYQELMENTK